MRDQTTGIKRKHFYLALMGRIGVAWICLFHISFRKIVKPVSEGIGRYSPVITRGSSQWQGRSKVKSETVPQARMNRAHGQVEAQLWQDWRGTHLPYNLTREWRCCLSCSEAPRLMSGQLGRNSRVKLIRAIKVSVHSGICEQEIKRCQECCGSFGSQWFRMVLQ